MATTIYASSFVCALGMCLTTDRVGVERVTSFDFLEFSDSRFGVPRGVVFFDNRTRGNYNVFTFVALEGRRSCSSGDCGVCRLDRGLSR